MPSLAPMLLHCSPSHLPRTPRTVSPRLSCRRLSRCRPRAGFAVVGWGDAGSWLCVLRAEGVTC